MLVALLGLELDEVGGQVVAPEARDQITRLGAKRATGGGVGRVDEPVVSDRLDGLVAPRGLRALVAVVDVDLAVNVLLVDEPAQLPCADRETDECGESDDGDGDHANRRLSIFFVLHGSLSGHVTPLCGGYVGGLVPEPNARVVCATPLFGTGQPTDL